MWRGRRRGAGCRRTKHHPQPPDLRLLQQIQVDGKFVCMHVCMCVCAFFQPLQIVAYQCVKSGVLRKFRSGRKNALGCRNVTGVPSALVSPSILNVYLLHDLSPSTIIVQNYLLPGQQMQHQAAQVQEFGATTGPQPNGIVW